MSIFTNRFKSFAKKAIIPLCFALLLNLTSPLMLRADEVTDAQQSEIQIYLEMRALRERLESEAQALRDSLRPQEPEPVPAPAPVPVPPEQEPVPAPTPEPIQTSQNQESGTGDPAPAQYGTEVNPTPTSTSSGEADTQTPSTTSGNTGGSSGSGGGVSTPFENLLANLHPGGPTTEIDASTNATSTATTTPGVQINNQGDDSISVVDATTSEQDTIETDNSADVDNTQEHVSDSGNNTISCNGICEGKLTTGAAQTDSTGGNKINTSNVATSSGGSGSVFPWMRYGTGPESGIENGGDDAVNIGDNTFVKDLAIIQKNDALLKNNYNIVANTGGNDLLTTFKLKDFDAITGEGRSRLTLLNMVNTNLVDSEWWPLYVGIDKEHNNDINIMDELLNQFGSTAKFNLFDPFCKGSDCIGGGSASIANSGEDAFNRAVSDLQVKISANSENSGLIHNKIRVACNSGHNTASSPYKIKDLNLTTGDCGASLTMLNFLNTYLVNAQWAMPVINIFGKWAGDLVLPSPDELLNTAAPTDVNGSRIVITNSGEDAFSKALVIDRTQEEVFVKNDLNVKSKVTTVTNAGGDFLGFADDLEDSTVKTGNATHLASQFMLGNTTKVGGGFLSLMVNDLSKKWLGGIEGAPEDAEILRDERGVVLTAERSGSLPTGNGVIVDRGSDAAIGNTGDDALNIAEVHRDRQIVINSSNNGSIVNDVTVESYTGNNMITGLTGTRINLKDGNSQTNTMIGNVVNTTMIGAKAMNVIVNVFGEWNGKVIFGKAVDLLSIITPSKSGNLAPGENVTYTVDYQNSNDKETTKNAKLTANYDASKMELIDHGGATEGPAGTLTWTIGDVPASGGGQKTFSAKVRTGLPIGNHTVQATSNVTSERPESNKDNNQDATSNTVVIGGGNGPVTPPALTGGEGTVTGSAQQGGNPNNGSGNQSNTTNNGSGQTGNTNGNTSYGGSNTGNTGGQFNTPGGSSSSGSSAVTFKVAKSANVSSVAQGGVVKYKVTLQNTGTESASSVKVFDKLKVNNTSSPDDEFSWEIGTVPAGETVTVDYDVNIEHDAVLGAYTNTAYASGFDSRNKVVLSNDSMATVIVGQAAASSVQGSGNTNSGNVGGNGTGDNNTNQEINSENTDPSTTPYTLHPTPLSGNHSEPRSVTITHPDGTTEVLGNGSGRSTRSTPNVTRGEATINRMVLLSGALAAQAQTVNGLITNTNGPVNLLAMNTMDQVLGEQVARERNYGFLMYLWFLLLLLLVIVGYMAWREQRKANESRDR